MVCYKKYFSIMMMIFFQASEEFITLHWIHIYFPLHAILLSRVGIPR